MDNPSLNHRIIPSSFTGDILAISDADMIATAYANGITNKVAGLEDSLMHISVRNNLPTINSRVHATNSVISWPAILAWNPAYQYAYVAETRGKIKAGTDKMNDVFSDFPSGKKISVFDYQDPSKPLLLQERNAW